MAQFRVRVMQVYKVYSSTSILVEADSYDAAERAVSTGEVDLPPRDNLHWEDQWDLQNEEYEQG
jgi:hypothetical protein